MENAAINERLQGIAAGAAAQNGTEFVHSEVAGTKRSLVLRVFIDKPGGVTIEDCSNVSRAIEAVLDAEDFVHTAYVLEVSSPGLERQLYTLEDFRKFVGQKAKVKTSVGINSQKIFTGRISSVEDEDVLFEDRTQGSVRIPFETVMKANLQVDLSEEFKKRRARPE
jgi:ribosome maturation factor RimP